MTVAVPVVWLDTAKTAPSENVAAVAAWARSRGLRLTGLASDDRLALPYPEAVVARVEAELDRAREAIAALDGPTTDAASGRAEAELFAHPEVPHSAWLLAEILRARAARSKTIAPESPAAAAAALTEAKRLDGGRMAGLRRAGGPRGRRSDPARRRHGRRRGGRGQAALALVTGVIRRSAFSVEIAAEALVAWLDSINGAASPYVGPSTKAAYQAVQRAVPPAESGRGGATNGAAMRVAPLGFLHADFSRVVRAAADSALPTHNSPLDLASAAAVAGAVHAAARGAPLAAVIGSASRGADEALTLYAGPALFATVPNLGRRIQWAVKLMDGELAGPGIDGGIKNSSGGRNCVASVY